MSKIIAIVMMLGPSISFAQSETTYSIKQLLLAKDRAVISFTGEPPSESADLLATFKSGKQCLIVITKVKGKIAAADTSKCQYASELTVGQKLELAGGFDDEDGDASKAKKKNGISDGYKRELTDLQFMPDSKHFFVQSSYQDIRTTISTSFAGLSFDSITTAQQSATAVLGYGITKEFAVALQVGWLFKNAEQDSYGPSSILNGQTQNFASSGNQDPAVGLKYRFLEQDEYPLTLDLQASYSPKINSKTGATTLTNGNAARGGDLTKVELDVGQKVSKFNYAAALGYNFYGNASSNNADTGVETDTSSYGVFVLGIAGQFQVMDWLYLSAGISQAYYGAEKTANLSTDAYNQFMLTGGVTGVVIPDHFAVTLQYASALQSNITASIGPNALTGSSSTSIITVGLLGEF